jgi:single-strand DNA-binding protein
MVNKVILIGGLTRDAESLMGSRGAVTRLRLATTTHWRDAEGVRHEASEYHNLVAFNRLAEICAQYCLKGRRIYIEGRLRTREYDGADGLRRTSTEVVVETMRLVDRREDGHSADLTADAALLAAAAAAAPQDTVRDPIIEEDDEDEGAEERPVENAADAELALSGAGKR